MALVFLILIAYMLIVTKLKPDLVVALAGCPMANRIGTNLFGDFNLPFGN